MNPDDFEHNEDENATDYWAIIRGIDQASLLKNLALLMRSDPKGTKLQTWMDKNQQGLVTSFIKGVEEGLPESFRMSLHDFGLYVFVVLTFQMEEMEDFVEEEPVEIKPQSTKLQKELEQLYKEDNIQKEIDNMLNLPFNESSEEDED